MIKIRNVVVPILIIILSACGSGGGDESSKKTKPKDEITKLTSLSGDSAATARDVVKDYLDRTPVKPETVEVSSGGEKIVRTQLEFRFKDDATVEQINTLLKKYDATILSTLEGFPSMIIEIPDPGGLTEYNKIFTAFAAESIVNKVYTTPMSSSLDVAPPDMNFRSSTDIQNMDHHLAVGFPAAWNAQGAIKSVPEVVIHDFFGAGMPYVNRVTANFIDPSQVLDNGNGNSHGYHVLGIMGLNHQGKMGGAMPKPFNLSVHDITDGLDSARGHVDLVAILKERSKSGTLVLNTSIGHVCRDDALGLDLQCSEEIAGQRAVQWIERVRGAGLENKVLHVTSAGNIDPNFDFYTEARLDSYWGSAALMGTLFDDQDNHVAKLTNTLVVENADVLTGNVPDVGCVSETSKTAADAIAGIGVNVHSIISPDLTLGDLTGTSMSAPQVAGLATYMLGLRPNLTPQQLISIIRSTTESVVADDNGCATTKPSQIIRPYKAVLALDSFNDAPVRAAILDVAGGSTVGAGDGVFDNKDIEAYIAAFQAAEAIGDDTDYNYGRFDLNGDVHQGGNNTRPFDLNINGDTLDSETVEVNGSGRRFVEHEMSDRAILCYYSHSFLFSGDLAALSEENRNYLFADCGELVDARIFFVTIDSSEEIIASMAPDGSNYKAETDIFEHTFALTPTVVPGTQIVAFLGEKSTGFGSSAQFTNGIFIQYRSRNSSTLVVEGAYRPSISEKLGKIYYEKSIQREGEFYWDVVLFRSNFDGSEEEQLTNSVGLNSQVSISPDGSKMVFVTLAEDYSYSTLKISDARGNGVSNIPVSGLMENPSWSPDSKKIVYDRYEGQNRNIYIYDTVTGENKALTNYSGNGPLKKAWEPTWSPDGNKIAFAGADGTNATEIYTITIDGTELTNITNTPNVKDDSPAWGS